MRTPKSGRRQKQTLKLLKDLLIRIKFAGTQLEDLRYFVVTSRSYRLELFSSFPKHKQMLLLGSSLRYSKDCNLALLLILEAI